MSLNNKILLSVEEINKIIDDEIEFARDVNPHMAMGMIQVQKQINKYAGDKNNV